ncbi:MAG: hypothetical protein LC772_07180, partial [Chloroflexi bacterium]|nr:hypothetical protein [Chloroflexota bacterium]
MTPSDYIDAVAACTNAVLGLFVLARAPRGEVQRAFACLAISISVWIISILTVQTADGERLAHVGIEAAFASSLVMAASMVWFGALFPGPNRLANNTRLKAFVIAGTLLAALSPFGAYDRGVHKVAGGLWAPHRGPLSPVGSLYLVLAAVYFLYCVWVGWRNSRGLQRAQLQYLLLGSILALVGAFSANLIAPLIFHSSRYESFGPAASLLFVLASGYSIARYRLLEISQVILKSVAFGLALTVMAVFFLTAVVLLNSLAASVLGVHTVEAQAVAAMALAMLFQPLYQALRRLLNIVFVRRPYDYAQTLRAASRAMASMLDLEQLRTHVSDSITDHMQVEWAGLSITRGQQWLPDPESAALEEQEQSPNGATNAPASASRNGS